MRIGLHTDSVGELPLDEALDTAAEFGIESVELATGGWSSAPHIDLQRQLGSDSARRELLAAVGDRGLTISALNCNGNQLDPTSGAADARVVQQTVELAALLGVDRVVLMSGCPGGPGDRSANWITVAWPPQAVAVLEYQWDEVVIPYWRELAALAAGKDVRLCVEMHGQQVVYNVPTLLRLRQAAGSAVGANLDPSHLMWMGADPIAAIDALGDAIFHVHAKDVRLEPSRLALTSRLDTAPTGRPLERSWNYVTLGHGHDESFWRQFCAALVRVGYDGVLSIEHEDVAMTPVDGVRESTALLRRVLRAAEPAGAGASDPRTA